MTESKQTIDEQLETEQTPSPGARAPGDGAQRPRDAASAPVDGDAASVLAGDGAAGPAAADAVGDAHAADADVLQGDLDELGALAAKRDEYLALAQRTQADFENYRKRVARESALAAQRGVAKLAKELLPAIDNLDRALDAAASRRTAPGRPEPSEGGPGGAAEDTSLLDGVRLVRAELGAGLARVGVESFSPLGESFDPVVHEAIATVPQPPEGGAASGTVVEVYQPGYRLGESVIRPARVVVAA
jgi:molecular chaperone GrpE